MLCFLYDFRCLSVINPLKSESRSAGSWRGLMVNMRLLLLTAYDRTLVRFEEFIRDQREKRNQPGWSFCKYFLLQVFMSFLNTKKEKYFYQLQKIEYLYSILNSVMYFERFRSQMVMIKVYNERYIGFKNRENYIYASPQ